MSGKFNQDTYPGKPKILFIGWADSTHTHSWIDLLQDAKLNVRMFGLDPKIPPHEWMVKTYVTVYTSDSLNPQTRLRVYPPLIIPFSFFNKFNMLWNKAVRQIAMPKILSIEACLAKVIKRWQPDIIHTLGLNPASYLYLRACKQFNLGGIGKWVVQARGGPDLALHRLLPSYRPQIENVFNLCDQFIADNQRNYKYATELGLADHKLSSLGVVSGTGGIDVISLEKKWNGLPSQRERLIVWPKTYEAPSSKAHPVLEAIKIAWTKIKPCRIEMLWVVQPEIEMWLATYPEEIRNSCYLQGRIPREQVLEMFSRARVMLTPSLTDGIPNSMLEAMALGAFPIVSPIETITPVVKEVENVLFARNLYPHEIAAALERAMTDDKLVDQAAKVNIELIRRIADRAEIRPRVVKFYIDLSRIE